MRAATLPGALAAQRADRVPPLGRWMPDTTKQVEHDSITGRDILVLRNGETLFTGLHHVRFLGLLATHRRPPYLVLEGEPCDQECDAFGREIRIEHPTNPTGDFVGYEAPGRGRSSDPDDTLPTYDDRMFIGHCLPKVLVGVVWYARHRVDHEWEALVHVVAIEADTLRVTDLAEPPLVTTTLAMVKAGICQESR
jgi:hypothetical protein